MAIYEHYYEALDVMGEMFNHIFDGIYERFQQELATISVQYPFEPIKYLRPPLRISYEEGIAMLHEAGITEASVDDDLSTPHEKVAIFFFIHIIISLFFFFNFCINILLF